MQFLDIILLAAVAAFLILRLRSVLGKRGGHEGPSSFEGFKRDREAGSNAEDKVITLPDRGAAEAEQEPEPQWGLPPEEEDLGEGAVADGLRAIKAEDPSFAPKPFTEGARVAFDMIIGAFAAGDTKALRPLLADEVFENFSGAVKAREEAGETLETQLIGINKAEIVEAEMQGKTAFVTVKFVSEQINVTKDSEGRIVEGAPNEVVKITDLWTFARNVKSRDPNWKLVATQTPN